MKQKRMNNRAKRLMAALLACALCLSLAAPTLAEEGRTVHLKTAEDLREFSQNCSLDTWSQAKTVILDNDIALPAEASTFLPVPSFGGSFDGGGHTISGFSLTDGASPAGLFGILQTGAVVKNLNLIGTVTPTGDADTMGGIAGINYGQMLNCTFEGVIQGNDTVGGIVGLNEITGQLIHCTFKGILTGKHYVGGIAGQNAGSLIRCENVGSVNTTEVSAALDISSINLSQFNLMESVPASTDIGGIAGFSTGLLQSCKNSGNVGYEHVGYNVGGIAGRQTGYLDGCTNSGTVKGRKDVGGIAGQMEPQVTLKYSESTLGSLWDELDTLQALIDKAADDIDGSSSNITESMNGFTSDVRDAKDAASALTDALSDWGNENIEQINDASARLSWVIDQMDPILADVSSAMSQLETASGQIADALEDADEMAELGKDAAAELRLAAADIETAVAHGKDAVDHIQAAADHLEQGLGDSEKTEAALKELKTGIIELSEAFIEISGAVSRIVDALDKAADWVQNDPAWVALRDGLTDLRAALTEVSAALEDVGSALEKILQSGATEENLELLSDAMTHLSAATQQLDAAYDSFSAALDAYNSGDLSGATEQLAAGLVALQAANDEMGKAQEDISTILENWNSEEMQGYLKELEAAVSRLNQAMAHANDAIAKVNAALDQIQASDVPQETVDAIRRETEIIQTNLDKASAAAQKINAALEALDENIDLSQIDSAVAEMKDAADDLELCVNSLDKAASHCKTAMDILEDAAAKGDEVSDHLAQANETMGDAVSRLRQAVDKTRTVFQTLADKPAIAFQPISSDITERGDALGSALTQVLDSTETLTGVISSASGTLTADLRAINDQIGVIADLLRTGLEEEKDASVSDRFEDVSAEDPSADQSAGRISGARNTGCVEGDINVAGIVGSLSIEYDFDPEDDLTEDGDRSLDFRYEALAVVSESANEGAVTAKKDYVGGIVGRMDLGSVNSCEGYGSVSSSNGDYVGGIAGLSRATVRGCYAKCTLSGSSYIGGILGAGESESDTAGCYSMVEISDAQQHFGAVSGSETGNFTENYFVSEDLAGLGRVSYAGKAAPISFDELAAAAGMPAGMTTFYIRFLLENEVLQQTRFTYGDSFDETIFPAIPQKEGCYAAWDADDLTSLHFDRTVTATYFRYVLALPSAVTRESGRPVFLAEGNFDADAALTVSPAETSMGGFSKQLEQWTLLLPDDGQETHTLRYLAPEEAREDLDIYIKRDGSWHKVKTGAFGSYLTFELAGATGEIAVVAANSAVWLWAAAAAVVILLALFLLLRRGRKNGKPRKQAAGVAAPTPEAVENGDETKKVTKPGGLSGDKKTRNKRRFVLLGIAALCVAAAGICFGLKMKSSVDVYRLLTDYAQRPELSMDVTIEAQVASKELDVAALVTKTELEGRPIVRVEQNEIPFYLSSGMVVLENGTAYGAGGQVADYSGLLANAAKLYGAADSSISEENGETCYTVTAAGESAQTLLEALLPSVSEYFSGAQQIVVELSAEGDALHSIRFSSDGTLNDAEHTHYSVSAKALLNDEIGDYEIPEEVKNAVLSGTPTNRPALTDDLVRLLSAWSAFHNSESFAANIQLSADCGPVSVDDALQYTRALAGGSMISSLRRGNVTVYFSPNGICGESGAALAPDAGQGIDAARLFELAYQLCMNGDYSCAESGANRYLYTLSMDKSAIEAAALAIAPSAKETGAAFESGSLQLIVENGKLSSIRIDCSGNLSLLPVSFTGEITSTDADGVSIPRAVIRALGTKEVAGNE